MEKTNLLTLQGNQEDLEQSIRYEYSQFYSLSLGTILLIIIYFYLSSLDKTLDTSKQQSILCLLFIIAIISLFYILKYV